MPRPPTPQPIDRPAALRIIEKLRQGTDCLEGVSSFSCGRGVLLAAATDLFEELEISGGALVRWIRGRTGQGKTHFFARLMEIAHGRNWVTSYVQISDRGFGTELHRFEEVYAAVVRNCLCRELLLEEHGLVEPGRVSGWNWILDDWWSKVRSQAGKDGAGVPTFRVQDAINQTLTAIQRKWSIHASFAEALRQFALSRVDGEEEWTSVLRRWFRGEDVHVENPDVRARLRRVGIKESLNRRNAKEMLRSMSAFVRYRGYGGILILVDELENILHQPPVARRTGYTILRELIDNIDDRHGMTHAAFYVSATPDVFDSPKGISEYEALAERVLLPGGRNSGNPVAAVLDLAAWPFTHQELLEMSGRIAGLHGTARAWRPDGSTGKHLANLLGQSLARDPDLTPRSWVKSVVDELDLLYSRRA